MFIVSDVEIRGRYLSYLSCILRILNSYMSVRTQFTLAKKKKTIINNVFKLTCKTDDCSRHHFDTLWQWYFLLLPQIHSYWISLDWYVCQIANSLKKLSHFWSDLSSLSGLCRKIFQKSTFFLIQFPQSLHLNDLILLQTYV